MTAAQAVVECMKREDVSNVFCVPGESYLPVLDALYDTPSIQVIAARHEGGAAFMAEGYAKSALKTGVVLATRGVGAANLSIGVHTAYQDSTPMVVFLGQVHSKFKGREGFQEIDLDNYFQPITKWTVEVNDPDRIPELVQRAFRVAKSGRPGPVVVSLPEDVLPRKAAMRFGPVSPVATPAPSETEIIRVNEILSQAKRPLIIAGGGVKQAEAEVVLTSFANKYNIPVIASFRRHDVFPNDHPLYAGHLGLGTNQEIIKTVAEADVIVALGTRLSEVTTQDYTIMTEEKKLIHIDISHEVIGQVYAPDIGIVADVKEALSALLQLNLGPSWHEWADGCQQRYRQASSLSVKDGDVINKRIIHSMATKLPASTLLTNDAGNFAGWLHAFYPFTLQHTYVGPTSGAMGYGLPAAIGAKLAYPEKLVVSLSGDGGFMMTVQELETAVRYNIPVIALVFNNNMYGTIRMHQELYYPEKVIATDLGTVSFAKMAESVGAKGYFVSSLAQFEQALTEAISMNVPTVIEIRTEKEQISVAKTITQLRDQARK
ncbi:thiamine pyrophosphate-dependent enzyme [Virgibacillus sp. MG-45]